MRITRTTHQNRAGANLAASYNKEANLELHEGVVTGFESRKILHSVSSISIHRSVRIGNGDIVELHQEFDKNNRIYCLFVCSFILLLFEIETLESVLPSLTTCLDGQFVPISIGCKPRQ